MKNERTVVITGLGIVSNIGTDLETFWSSLSAGKSGIGPIERWDTSDFTVTFAGEISDFDPDPWIDGRAQRRMDRFSEFAIAASDMALEDAGIDTSALESEMFGAIIGSGVGGLESIQTQTGRLLNKGPNRVSPFLIPQMMINAASGLLAIRHGAEGPNYGVTSACAASSHAIGLAMQAIRNGQADIILTGGTEAAITPLGVAAFQNMKALAKWDGDPSEASRPFDKGRCGFVMGEGAGICVLESLEHAEKRGATIYGELSGFGMTDDASHITAPHPEGKGAVRAMRLALKDAGLNPEDVDYINAHGTSTPLNDKMETLAIKILFGDHAEKLAVSSTKSMTGHLLGGAGGLEIVATTLALKHGVAPPTINYETPDPDCDLDYVPNEARELPIKAALSNSFGFGGHNVCLAVNAL